MIMFIKACHFSEVSVTTQNMVACVSPLPRYNRQAIIGRSWQTWYNEHALKFYNGCLHNFNKVKIEKTTNFFPYSFKAFIHTIVWALSLNNDHFMLLFIALFWSFCSDCAPKEAAPQGRDDAAARRLWDLSASMVGLAWDNTLPNENHSLHLKNSVSPFPA